MDQVVDRDKVWEKLTELGQLIGGGVTAKRETWGLTPEDIEAAAPIMAGGEAPLRED